MNASTDVPLTITPEAAARIAELGVQKEFEQMIAYVREMVPELTAIEVVRELPYDTDWEPISITAYSDQVFATGDNTSAKLAKWRTETFPPQVLEHLVLLLSPGRPYAG
ncbi:MAG TPA: hypothetical protein VH575_29570 [Gemmataceae bacterium]|jgi:hypothetical protein